MSDHLFDPVAYGGYDPVAVRAESSPIVEPYESPYVLLANRHGVIGFHIPESVTEYSTTFALCGAKGHSVTPPETMVRCSECERLRLLP
jgi:hypothetical protein